MLTLITLIVAMVATYRIAENDRKNGIAWAGVTFLLTIVLSIFIGSNFVMPFLAAFLSFILMMIVNVVKDESRA